MLRDGMTGGTQSESVFAYARAVQRFLDMPMFQLVKYREGLRSRELTEQDNIEIAAIALVSKAIALEADSEELPATLAELTRLEDLLEESG